MGESRDERSQNPLERTTGARAERSEEAGGSRELNVAPLDATGNRDPMKAGIWFALGCVLFCLPLVGRSAEEGALDSHGAPVVHPTEMDSDRLALQTEPTELLAREPHDQIERRAQELRVSRVTFLDGYWRLGAFFCGLSMAVPGSWASDSDQEAHIGLQRNWVREKTNSVIARTVLGRSADMAREFCYQACKAGGPGHGAPAVRARGQRPSGASDLAHVGAF